MRKVALRGLLAHKLRLLATFLAIGLGVAFIGGILVMTDTMNRTFDDLFASAYAGTDAVVRSNEVIEGELGEEDRRGTLDAALLDQVRAIDTVAEATGEVEGVAQLIGRDGDPVGGGSFDSPTVAAGWDPAVNDDADSPLNPLRLRDGQWLDDDGEIMIDAGTARSADYAVGDSVPVQTEQGVGEYTVAGVIGFGSADSPAGQGMVLFTTEEAQRVIGEPGRFDAISLTATEGVSEDQVVDDVQAVVGDELEVLSGTEITEQSQSDLRTQLSFLTIFFMVFAVIAVVVGSFVIYNSFSIIVAQRTREMALLRAVGASRAQVRRAVLIEALAVGSIGSVAGFVLGLGVATALINFLGIEGALAVVPTSAAIAIGCGVVVTLVSALVPARRASKVPPVAALRDAAIETAGHSRLRLAVGFGLAGLGAGAVVAGATGGTVSTVGLGVAANFLGLLLMGPALARPVSRLVGWPLGRLRGISGVLARQNAGRNPKRSASTAQALMIGVGIVGFFLVLNASLRASIDKVLDENFAGDFVIDSGNLGMMGLPPEVAERIAAQPQVETVVPYRLAPARITGQDGAGRAETTAEVAATNAAGFSVFGLEVVAGSDALGRGEVVVSAGRAERDGLAVGDRLQVDFLDASAAPLTVAGIYSAPSDVAGIGDFVIGVDEMTAQVPEAADAMVLVELVDGATIEDAEPVLEDAVEQFPTANVQSAEEYKDAIGGQLDIFLQLVLGLLVLAIVIAMLGIANTVALSVLERTRELGLLRAVGMTRRQLRSVIRWESVIIALFGALLGLAVGVLGSWGMVAASEDEGLAVFQVPVGTLALLALLAGGLGMVAALAPAWRASRLDVLDAIHAP
jgi:putative ABC transport system permease protein